MALEQERQYFDANKQRLLDHHRGQFVLIHDSEMLGAFPSFEDAYGAGIAQVGNAPFLIEKVTDEPTPVQYPALCVGLISAHS